MFSTQNLGQTSMGVTTNFQENPTQNEFSLLLLLLLLFYDLPIFLIYLNFCIS